MPVENALSMLVRSGFQTVVSGIGGLAWDELLDSCELEPRLETVSGVRFEVYTDMHAGIDGTKLHIRGSGNGRDIDAYVVPTQSKTTYNVSGVINGETVSLAVRVDGVTNTDALLRKIYLALLRPRAARTAAPYMLRHQWIP